MQNPEITRRGLMLVLSSPSGAGKTTISRRILASDDNIDISVSVTTRSPRTGEVDGVDYHFLDRETVEAMIARGELLEHAEVHGNHYGTPKGAVEAALSDGRDILFDIDWQGTQQLSEHARSDLVSVFILPPSGAALESRLRTRAQDSDEVVQRRLAEAGNEISHYAEYDYIIVNQDIDESVARVTAILEGERSRRERQPGLGRFVRHLQDELDRAYAPDRSA